MKKTLLLSSCMAMLGGLCTAHAATVLFDFNGSMLSTTSPKEVVTKDSGSGFTVTLSAVSNLSSSVTYKVDNKTSYPNTDWSTEHAPATLFTTENLETFIGGQVEFGDSWKTFISSGKGDDLTLTISGLKKGSSYQIALVTGCPFEEAGAWASLTTDNECDEASPVLDGNNITVREPVGFTIKDIVADANGEITLTVAQDTANGKHHSSTFNALAISGATDSVPEPATASLSLLGLSLLMLRRKR